MSFQATVFNVFIASPGDVSEERKIVRKILYEWNAIHADERGIVLLPWGWETHSAPDMSGTPQSTINRQVLADSDLLVGVFWTRIGTATQDYLSGTVEEIERHLAAGKPTMLYFSEVPINPSRIDDEQRNALKAFRESCQVRGLYEPYQSTSEFELKFRNQLIIRLKESYFKVQVTSNAEAVELIIDTPIELSPEEKSLLKEASKDKSGFIMKTRFSGGLIIQTNKINFVEARNPRSEAMWTAALDNLLKLELVKPLNHKDETFKVTLKGYAEADSIAD